MKQVAGALIAALVCSTGCAMTFQDHLPDRPSSPPATPAQVASCSPSRTLPWVDVAISAVEIAAATVILAAADTDTDKTLGMSVGGAGFMQGVSGGNGFKRAAACERAKAGQLPRTALAF